MIIKKIVLRKMEMQLKVPFETSFASMKTKKFIVVEIHSKDHVGYGECSALAAPWYSEETIDTAWLILQNFLLPILFDRYEIVKPEQIQEDFSWIRRNKMAKAAIDCALWDLYAKEKEIPLATALGGTRKEIETGVSIGIQKDPEELLRTIDKYMKEGYRRVKIKIKPGKDIQYLSAVRKEFGDIMLMADANSAYTFSQLELLKQIDEFRLLMLEQPLANDDIVDHAKLQKILKTRICLDESIESLEDARKAIELGSMKTINIKVARVGGLTEAKKIHDLCKSNDIPVWCGGMLDTGIGRAHNITIASLPNYSFPGDIPASDRYYAEDFMREPVQINKAAMIQVPVKNGIGMEPIEGLLDTFTFEKKEFLR